MGAHDHRDHAGSGPVSFHVVIVSTTRTAETDEAGPLLQDLLEEAGHRVTGRSLLPDDPAAVRARVRTLQEEGRTQAVILSGGTGISRRDRTVEAVRELFDLELPGFGEIFRRLSYERIGAAAMLSRAVAGVAGGLPIFALPGSPDACRLALEHLILPEIHHLLHELAKEGTATAPHLPAPLPPGAVRLEAAPTPAPETDPPPEASGAGWEAAIQALGGEIRRGQWPVIPEPPGNLAPVRNVLESAGQRAALALPDGVVAGLFGFPDLVRPSAKVLLVGPGEPWGTVIALHRFPRPAGLATTLGLGGIPTVDASSREVASDLTGRPGPGGGTLFAVDGSVVYLLLDGRVRSWDGRRERDEGPPGSVLSSLVLRWSSR